MKAKYVIYNIRVSPYSELRMNIRDICRSPVSSITNGFTHLSVYTCTRCVRVKQRWATFQTMYRGVDGILYAEITRFLINGAKYSRCNVTSSIRFAYRFRGAHVISKCHPPTLARDAINVSANCAKMSRRFLHRILKDAITTSHIITFYGPTFSK